MTLGLGGYIPNNLGQLSPDDILASILATGSTSELNTNARMAECRRQRHRIESGNPAEKGHQAAILLDQYGWALPPEERMHVQKLVRQGKEATEELNKSYSAAAIEDAENPPPRPPSSGLSGDDSGHRLTREKFEREFWATYTPSP